MINLWINSETNALLPNWNAFGTATLPQIKQGDKILFDIHWVKSDPAGQFMEEVVIPPLSTIKVAVGIPNGVPTGGYFVYNFLGDTVQIPYNATAAEANTLINGLPSIISAGGVAVSIVNQRTYRIVFNEVGARAISSCDPTPLSPSTVITVIRINAGGPTSKEVQHLRPKQLPVAYSDSFTNAPEPVISIVDIDSITKRISISPSPKFGTFTISNGTGTTSALSINSSASDVLKGLTDSGISSTTRTYSVAKSGDYSWDIYRTSGTSETLTITTTGLVGFSSKTGTVEFNTLEVEDLLAGQPSVSATIEVEYSYGLVRQTLYQGRVTIVNDIIDEATYNPVPFPELIGGIGEAPQDGVLYGRKDGVWSAVIGDGNNIPDYDNSLIYTVGNQVYYQGKLYRMIVSVGGAGYDPVGYPSYWESLSGSNPDLSGYVEKTGAVMSLGASLNFLNTFSELSIGAGGVGVYSNTNPESVLLFENRLEVSNGTNTTKVIPSGITFPDLTTQSTAAVTPDLSGYAPLNSPALTGVPTAPTPASTDNSTTLATTAFVANAVANTPVSLATQKVLKTVRNATASIITKGSVVYISGANGTHPTIVLAQANSESTSYRTFGVTNEDIAINGDGDVVIIGEVSGVNTGSFADGDQLYLSPTIAGGVTNSKPSAPEHLVYVGVCTRANNVNGKIEVNITNGFELHELHDVAISLPKEDKQLVAYELSSNLWKNKSAATLGIAELSGATFTGKLNTLAPNATSAGINIGSATVFPSTTVAGDMFITNNALIYKDSSNINQTVLSGSKPNTINLNATISGTNTPLSITQSGQILGAVALSVSGLTSLTNPNSSNANGAVTIFNESSGPALRVRNGFVSSSEVVVIESNNSGGNALRITNTGTSNSLIVEDSANPDSTSFIINSDGNIGIGVPTAWASSTKFEVAGTSKFNDKATFTSVGGAAGINIGIGGVSTTALTAGDLWIPTGGANLNFRDGTGALKTVATLTNGNVFNQPQVIATLATATLPALRITNLSSTATAHSLVVEDSTNPDGSSFIVNSEGRIGIGVNPATFTGASGAKVRVEGEIECNINTTPCISNQILATTSYVKNSVVPNVIAVTDGSYASYTNNGTGPLLWNTIVKCDTSTEVNMQIPTEADSASIGNVAVGTQIVFIQTGNGQLNFSPNSVTILSSNNKFKTSGLYAVVTAIKIGADEWLLAGDLVS